MEKCTFNFPPVKSIKTFVGEDREVWVGEKVARVKVDVCTVKKYFGYKLKWRKLATRLSQYSNKVVTIQHKYCGNMNKLDCALKFGKNKLPMKNNQSPWALTKKT